MIGRSLCDLMPPEKREGFKAYLKRIQANHTDAGVIELIAADGTRHYWAYHNVLDTEADPPYVLGHAQDVTALRMQEQQLREMSFRIHSPNATTAASCTAWMNWSTSAGPA